MTPLLSPSHFSSCSFPRWHLVRNRVSVVLFGEKEATDSLPALGLPREIWRGTTADLGERHTDTYPESEWTPLEYSKLLNPLNTFNRRSEGSLKTDSGCFVLTAPLPSCVTLCGTRSKERSRPSFRPRASSSPGLGI